MARPGFVLDVDERTPPLLVHEGEGFRLQKFPLGSRVMYPPDALPRIMRVREAIATRSSTRTTASRSGSS